MTLARRPAAVVAAAVLALALTACGSEDGGGSGGAATEPAQGAPSTPSDSQVAAQEATGGEAPAGGVALVEGAKKVTATVTVSDDGFDPAELAISVGDVVRVTAGSGGPHRVVVNDLPSRRVSTGRDEVLRFEEPGTYRMTEETTGATAIVTVD